MSAFVWTQKIKKMKTNIGEYMKIVLTTLNAKFIHSSLALRCLKKYAADLGEHITILEYTINHQEEFILRDIYEQNPDVLCFSCYIWNITMIQRIIKNIKKLIPNLLIILGGPEVSYESESVLRENSSADIVIRGEGELTFYEVAKALIIGDFKPERIDGISYRQNGEICSNKNRAPALMDELPFAYDDLEGFEHKIIYYETQRGCPYNCQYCLSSVEKGVRFLSRERVERELQFFLDHGVKQVKFVDRTFNANKEHAKNIWRYLMDHDNGKTNFHMEITADIMDEESIAMLEKARPGLFQFEIGVQSTNEETIKAIQRNTKFEKLTGVVKKIKQGGNIHQHLDLIAGLPYENYESFRKSFNDVYALEPEQFQLGFLKLLKGSGLRRDAEKFGIVFRDEAVYEVLYTKDLPYEDVLRLKLVEEMVETYYNSGKTLYTLQYAVGLFPTPFDLYQELGLYWQAQGHHKIQHNKMELYTILYEFAKENPVIRFQAEVIRDFLKLDLFLGDFVRTLPVWLEEKPGEKERRWSFYHNQEKVARFVPALEGYTAKELSKKCYIGIFDFNIFELTQNPKANVKRTETAILFDYTAKDEILHHGAFYSILL